MINQKEFFKDKIDVKSRGSKIIGAIPIESVNSRIMDRETRRLLMSYYKKKINTLTKEIQEMIEGN